MKSYTCYNKTVGEKCGTYSADSIDELLNLLLEDYPYSAKFMIIEENDHTSKFSIYDVFIGRKSK